VPLSSRFGADAAHDLDIVLDEGLPADRVVVGGLDRRDAVAAGMPHAVAARGAYLAIDHVGRTDDEHLSDDERVALVIELVRAGHVDRILLSSNSIGVAKGHSADEVTFSAVLATFMPRLRAAGVGEADLHRILVTHPADLRTSELRITVPAPLRAVAGGRLVGVQPHADGTRTYHWRTEQPEPHHRTTFVVGEFAPVPQHHPRVSLMNLGYPDEAAGVAASVVMHADALDFLTRTLGQPFPHAGHTQVFVQDLPWNTPGTGLSVLTENFVDDLGTHHDFQYLWDGLQTESLAQQWYGGRWPLCDVRHVWLEKAVAHHLAALYTEHRHGRDEYLLWYVAANQGTALADAAQGSRDPVVPARAMSLDERAAFAAGNTLSIRPAKVSPG
jgi:hypothetical protein